MFKSPKFKKRLKSLYLKFNQFKIYFYKNILSDQHPEGNYTLNYPTLFLGLGEIKIADSATIGYFPSPWSYSGHSYIEARKPQSQITIGERTYINNNACIGCENGSVSIGDDCLIGPNFYLMNTDGHMLDPEKRLMPAEAIDVKIGNNVFIGSNVIILKGVNIGDNCVIGAGSIVTKSFPSNAVIAGNPAKTIKMLALQK